MLSDRFNQDSLESKQRSRGEGIGNPSMQTFLHNELKPSMFHKASIRLL